MPRRQVISPQLSNALKAAATHYLCEGGKEVREGVGEATLLCNVLEAAAFHCAAKN